MSKFIDRTGELSKNNQGMRMKIIKYKNNKDIDVQFEDGTIVKNQPYSVFKSGEIKNYNIASVNGVGYMGYGNYKSRVNGKLTEQYKVWSSMILRNYCPQYLERQNTYIDCEVCEEWHNFQNFAEWYDDNKWTNKLKLIPDKDILIKGNKIYSPDTVLLVDQRLNNLFLNHKTSRGEYPVGVYYDKDRNKYIAHCDTKEFNKKFIGRFDTAEEAFKAYKERKYEVVKTILNHYREKYNLPDKIYNAFLNYKIEITD